MSNVPESAHFCTLWCIWKLCTNIIQLTNWILWNGQFYYRDVIKMTITRAKGEGNGHFYHIEVIDLPFHTIPFVSCFISLIENMNFYWKFTSKFGIIFVLQSLLGSLFLALRTTLALMRRCVRSQELCARTMTMEDAYQVKITLQSRAPNVDSNSLTYFWFYCTAHAALCGDTHRIHVYYDSERTRNARAMK